MFRIAPLFALAMVFAPGCAWEEGLEINNMTGTLVLPREAATRNILIGEEVQTFTDTALIGPVVLGFYPSVMPRDTVQRYPHPEVGPLFDPTLRIGDTYPYGGTTIGTFRSACVGDMTCRVVSGRFVDFERMVSWYNDVLGAPLRDYNDEPITSGEYLRELCYNLYEYTSDAELRLTATEDRNADGALNEGDLDFVEREDGNFEADFIVWQQEYFENAETGNGFTAWAFMQAPPLGGGGFTTCAAQFGTQIRQYNQLVNSGAPQRDLLNRPSLYLRQGDWVTGEQADGVDGYIYQSPSDTPEIWLNHLIQ